MKNAIFRPEIHRRLALGWLACVIALLAALVVILPDSRLNSSVMALLPNQHAQNVPPELEAGFNQRLDRQLVWMVAPADGTGSAPALWWQQQLQQMSALRDITGSMDSERQQAWESSTLNTATRCLTMPPASA